MKRTRIILLGAIGLLVFIGVCTALLGSGSGEGDAQGAAPKATPTPDAPGPCDQDSERQYLTIWDGQMLRLSSIVNDMIPLFVEMSEDTSLILDEQWRSNMDFQLEGLSIVSSNLLEQPAPASLEAMEIHVHELATNLGIASRLYEQTFDELDLGKGDEANELIASSPAIMEAADAARQTHLRLGDCGNEAMEGRAGRRSSASSRRTGIVPSDTRILIDNRVNGTLYVANMDPVAVLAYLAAAIAAEDQDEAALEG